MGRRSKNKLLFYWLCRFDKLVILYLINIWFIIVIIDLREKMMDFIWEFVDIGVVLGYLSGFF